MAAWLYSRGRYGSELPDKGGVRSVAAQEMAAHAMAISHRTFPAPLAFGTNPRLSR